VPKTPVPPSISGKPFRLADAELAGLTRAHLRGRRFRRLYHDVYVEAVLPDSLGLRCAGAALVLPEDAAFSHHTAAALRRLPVPEEPLIHVALPAGVQVRVAGIRGHSGLRPEDVRVVEERRLTSMERTFLDLATHLDLVDLVVLGDAALRRGWTSQAALSAAVAAASRRRGLARARSVLPVLEPRSDSPMETRLRLVLVFGGLPRPEANLDVFDEHGQWVARPDLQYPAERIAIEYEGAHHRRDDRQYESDIFRDELLRDLGWELLKFTAKDVFVRPMVTVERVRYQLDKRRPLS